MGDAKDSENFSLWSPQLPPLCISFYFGLCVYFEQSCVIILQWAAM